MVGYMGLITKKSDRLTRREKAPSFPRSRPTHANHNKKTNPALPNNKYGKMRGGNKIKRIQHHTEREGDGQ